MLPDPGLGALLASLSLASSLFKPVPQAPLVDSLARVAVSDLGNAIGDTQGLSMALSDVQPLPLLEDLDKGGTPSSKKSTNTPAPGTSTSAPRPLGDLSGASTTISNPRTRDASCGVEPYDSPTVIPQTFPPFDQAKATVYRYRQQQGVNLGSWFVHEQWMTPSLFTCAAGKKTSELDIASGWGSTTSARGLLERHWDTFITADDFAYLASIGINTVRLPIGYWNLGPSYCQQTPFQPVADVYKNSWAHVVRAINMADEAGLGILVDLHGAVGSQNGQSHSGISDGQTNLFTNQADEDQTIAALTFLTQQLATVTNVVGIQILNEPQNVPQLADFYTRALTALRKISAEAAKLPFYIHDGFDLQRFSEYVSARTDFVVQDHHSYFVFTPQDDAESPESHTQDIKGSIGQSLATASQSQRNNLVIDEWSCALTPDSLSKEQDPEAARRQFCQSQMQVYQNNTAGWAFWSYTKEGCDSDEGWCFKHAVGKVLPPTFFSYPRQTNGSATGASGPNVTAALSHMQLPDMSEILDRAAQADTTELNSNKTHSLYTPGPITTSDAISRAAGVEPAPGSTSTRSSAVPSSYATASLTPSFMPAKREHRFSTIQSRRLPSRSQSVFFEAPDAPAQSASQHATVKGYSDGFLTAKIFATYGLSKLGFTGQYIEDTLRSLGTAVIESGNEGHYREWFNKGLSDGEALVRSMSIRIF